MKLPKHIALPFTVNLWNFLHILPISAHIEHFKTENLKLVHILFKYCVLGTSTVAIFLSNDHSLYAPIYLKWTSYLISFAWDQSTCKERVESNKIQNEKFLPTVGLKPTTLRFEVWCSLFIKMTLLHTCTADTEVYIVISTRMMKESVFLRIEC